MRTRHAAIPGYPANDLDAYARSRPAPGPRAFNVGDRVTYTRYHCKVTLQLRPTDSTWEAVGTVAAQGEGSFAGSHARVRWDLDDLRVTACQDCGVALPCNCGQKHELVDGQWYRLPPLVATSALARVDGSPGHTETDRFRRCE